MSLWFPTSILHLLIVSLERKSEFWLDAYFHKLPNNKTYLHINVLKSQNYACSFAPLAYDDSWFWHIMLQSDYSEVSTLYFLDLNFFPFEFPSHCPLQRSGPHLKWVFCVCRFHLLLLGQVLDVFFPFLPICCNVRISRRWLCMKIRDIREYK